MSDENLRFKREILGVALLLILGTLLIVFPFMDAIILAVATSYLLRFTHSKLDRQLKNEFLSSVIITSSVIAFISISLFLFLNNFNDLIAAVNTLAFDIQTNVDSIISELNLSDTFRAEINGFIQSISEGMREYLRNVLASIPRLLIDVGIYTVTSIYLYKDGSVIEDKIFEIIENLPENEEKILRSLIRSIDSIFRGVFLTQFTVAAILGVTSAVGFFIISALTSPIPFIPLWSLLIGVAALLPLVAAFMFYCPIGIYYLAFGEPLKGSIILIFGVLILNILPEIFLRPYIGSKRMDEHPLIIFLGFLAGPLTLGLKGLILGPLMLILSKEFILNYSELVADEDD